jgi:hypothetical protein
LANPTGIASADLGLGSGGLGDMLRPQLADETEEEKRRRRLGLSPTSFASAAQALGMGGGGLGGSKPA